MEKLVGRTGAAHDSPFRSPQLQNGGSWGSEGALGLGEADQAPDLEITVLPGAPVATTGLVFAED